jgi:protein O-mannosyl-transferase
VSGPAASPRRTWAALFAATAALLVYAPSLLNGFAYDDVAVVAADPRIHGFDIGALLGGGYWLNEGLDLYRPLTMLSFALDWSLAPQNPAWFHLGNVLLHALATALVVFLLARYWPLVAALFGGLLFALHPVHVEAVANVVGRAELLAAVFFLAACLAWTRKFRPGDVGKLELGHGRAVAGSTLILPDAPGELSAREASVAMRRVATPLLFALALFSKESAIMLPAVLPLLDFAGGRLRRNWLRDYIRANAPAYALLAVVAIGYLAVRATVLGGAVGPDRVDPALEVVTGTGARVLTALQAWPVYAELLFAPVTLLADYGPRILGPIEALDTGAALGAAILGLLMAVGGAALLARWRRAALGLLWFPVTILPVSNLLLPIGVLVAERTLYVPSIAVGMALAAGMERATVLAPPKRRLATAAAVLALLLFGARSLVRIPEWETTDTIMLALERDRPDSFRAQWHTARMARTEGDAGVALQRYAHALELWPYRKGLVVEAIAYAAEIGQLDYAAELSAFAVQQWPADVDAHRLLAATTLDRGDTIAARRYLKAGLALDPRDPALVRMGEAIGLHTDSAGERR